MNSIEHRIQVGLVLSLALAMTVLALLADYGVNRISQAFVATRLQHDSDNLIKALSRSADGAWELDNQYLPPIYQRVRSGHYFQVLAGQQRLRSRSLWDTTPAFATLTVGQSRTTRQHHQDEHWLVWQQGVAIQGEPMTLWIAEDIAPLEQQWRHFSLLIWGAMVVTLLVLVALQRRLLRSSFSQITAVRRAIGRLQQGEIASLSDQVPREIRPLTEEINHLVARLEQRISRSRTAMGNLAHELKRTLQHLHLLRDALPPDQQQECDAALAQIGRLIERELKRARIAGSPHPGRRFNPGADLPHLQALFQRIYPSMTLQFDIADIGELPYDRDDLLELVGNLVDNGCKFARSRVELAVTREAGALTLRVSDDGPGVDVGLLQRLGDRGLRVDETVSGSGLGLSICRMIVDSYEGAIDFSAPRAGSGLEVRVRLPALA